MEWIEKNELEDFKHLLFIDDSYITFEKFYNELLNSIIELTFVLLKVNRFQSYSSLDQNVEMVKAYFEGKDAYHKEVLALRKMNVEGFSTWVAKITNFNTFSLNTKKRSNMKRSLHRTEALIKIHKTDKARIEARDFKPRSDNIQSIFLSAFFKEINALIQQTSHQKMLNSNISLITEMCLNISKGPDFLDMQKEVEKYIFNVSTLLINENAVNAKLVNNFIDLARYLVDALVTANTVA